MQSRNSRYLWLTSNDVILLVLAFFAYRNGLTVIAILFAAAALLSTAYLLWRSRGR